MKLKRVCLLAVSLLFVNSKVWAATEISQIHFEVLPTGESEIRIEANGPLIVESQENQADNQVILNISDAVLLDFAKRNVDTSQFDSPISLISPYQLQDQPDQVRVVVQMRDYTTPNFSQSGNDYFVRVGGSGLGLADSSSSDQDLDNFGSEDFENLEGDSPDQFASDNLDDFGGEEFEDLSGAPSATSKKSDPLLNEFTQNQKTSNFTGKPITLKVRDADVRDVLRLIGEASGFNLVIGSNVAGKITLSLVDVPWDQALNVVLNTMKLGAERNENILRVLTLNDLTEEKLAQSKAKAASQQTAPRVTRVFPISYADLAELKGILEKFGQAQVSAGGASGVASTPGLVEVDQRTNSIVVQDISENLDRMAKLIEILDTQTPQVLVESRVVEASEEFTNALSGNLGFEFNDGTQQLMSGFNGGSPLDADTGLVSSVVGGQNSSDGGAFAGALDIGFFLPSVTRLNAFLSMSETERTAKVVSSPKTVVLNKQSANILSTEPTAQQQTTIVDGVTQTNFVITQANTSLNVTPTVTNDEGVLMDVQISRDVPVELPGAGAAVAQRSMQTRVLVESGVTLVIGGVYDLSEVETASGFPFLRKIPIIGALFGNKGSRQTRTELFIFITPKVLNTEKAGLAT